MIELTAQQREVVARKEESPLRALDPDTRTTYVLIPEELYQRIKSLLGVEEDGSFVADMYPHVMEVFGREGWDDPAMDVYNDLDPRKA